MLRKIHAFYLTVAMLAGSCFFAPNQATAQSARSSYIPEVNQKVVKFCIDNLGRKVHDGECGNLVSTAYKDAGAKPCLHLTAPTPPLQEDDYVWGRLLDPNKEAIYPGDIIQFRDVMIKIVYPNKYWRSWTYQHHTAVVYQVLGKNKYSILHQNVGDKTKTEDQKRVVQWGDLDLGHKVEGTVWFYRPIPK